MDDGKTVALVAILFVSILLLGAGWSEHSKRSAWQTCTTTMKDKSASEIIAVCGNAK